MRKRSVHATSTRRNPNEAGVTLLELTTALAILTAGLFGVIQMYFFIMGHTKVLNETAVARNVVQSEVEYLRSIPFDELTPGSQPVRQSLLADSRLYNAAGAVVIRDFPDLPGRLREVSVGLQWTGRSGRIMKQRTTTLIADYGHTR